MYNYLVVIIHFLVIKTMECHFVANKFSHMYSSMFPSQKYTIFCIMLLPATKSMPHSKIQWTTTAICEICVF